MPNLKMLAQIALISGVLIVVAELANVFPADNGATGIMGAILVAAGLISLAVIERPRHD